MYLPAVRMCFVSRFGIIRAAYADDGSSPAPSGERPELGGSADYEMI